MVEQVAAFTDTYLPTINGVSYTVSTWKERFARLGGRMEVVFPKSTYCGGPLEFPVGSVPFPFYDGVRLGQPRVPSGLTPPEIVHAHTPFAIGLAARRYAKDCGVPLVASYHTPAAEYARYLAPLSPITPAISRLATAYERWFYEQAALVITPSRVARDQVRDRLGVSTPLTVVSNGVDLERFRPEAGDTAAFRTRHSLGATNPLIGYTGRHGHEKRLEELIDAVARLTRQGGESPTLVLAGDGPARGALERRASERDVDARFLGFLERDELPSLYAALDVFAFPSPVETQGLVALEAIASGTPVVAANAGALTETVTAGVTGFHYEAGDVTSFAHTLEAALDQQSALEAGCLNHRPTLGVEQSLERLQHVYRSV